MLLSNRTLFFGSPTPCSAGIVRGCFSMTTRAGDVEGYWEMGDVVASESSGNKGVGQNEVGGFLMCGSLVCAAGGIQTRLIGRFGDD